MADDKKGKAMDVATPSAPVPKPPVFRGSAPSVVESEEATMEERIQKLLDALRAQRNSSRISNASFEIGRPNLQPTEDMRYDPMNIYSRPSIDMLYKLRPRAVSNNVATPEDMARVTVAIEGLGVPTEHVSSVIIQAVIYCKSTSSSVYLDPRGTFEYPGGAITADSVLAIMKRDANTLRRVCRLYAPVVWNHMLVCDDPPSDWQAMGFQRDERFAAFDFFDYVENSACIQPLEGLIRLPTPQEKIAHETHKSIALDRANRNLTYSNTGVEITGGRIGPEIVRNHNNANNKRQ
uniref:Capsid protein n=1 Tax=Potato virus H TaxID=1046402 RepID=A0A346CP46_9VIRU|nr:Coat protein [Potato virus H]